MRWSEFLVCSRRVCVVVQAAQQAFMAELFADALKFGGAVMIRRIVGIAHVDDLKDIQDEAVRYVATTVTSKS